MGWSYSYLIKLLDWCGSYERRGRKCSRWSVTGSRFSMLTAVYMCEMERRCRQDLLNEIQENWCPQVDRLPASEGVTYELCAGIVDKAKLSVEETACKEVFEECGYDVPVASLKRITSCRYVHVGYGIFRRQVGKQASTVWNP